MTLIFQVAVALLAAILDFGPFGRQLSPWLGLTSGIVFVWAFSWFGRSADAFRFAVLQGLAFSLIGFLSPVTWLAVFVGAHFLTEFLKARFFEVSSVLLALVTLMLASIWESLVLGVAAQSFDPLTIAGHILANGIAGAVLYYFLGIRFKFLQRWAGRRL